MNPTQHGNTKILVEGKKLYKVVEYNNKKIILEVK